LKLPYPFISKKLLNILTKFNIYLSNGKLVGRLDIVFSSAPSLLSPSLLRILPIIALA
jgi:hypothetical protein